ncbi:hypothetical protein ACRDNQ_15350 [Palleronia sp. KMU-117]|uniref:hypothetical protein n=1 Tax=Palleronia sp. KMU-117 TaxID=3434108 RepID=UPI003D704C31
MHPTRLIAPFLLSTALAAQVALACAFHNYAPGSGLVDRLMASEHIVLVRPDPADPTVFAVVEALEGPGDDVAIPEAVDPATLARLQANPDDAVLFAREEAYGPWTRISYVGPGFRGVLDKVMARLPDWELAGDMGRFSLFAAHVADPDPDLSEAALREVDLADYSLLRRLPFPDLVEPALARIDDPAQGDLRPIRILLLGLSADPRAEAYLWPAFGRALASDGAVLGAYATALIELGGVATANRLVDDVLLNADLPIEKRELVVEAFALHSQSGAPETGAAARAAIGRALAEAPDLAGPVARQFGMRGDFSQHEPLAGLMNERKVGAIADMMAVSQYVMFAREGN